MDKSLLLGSSALPTFANIELVEIRKSTTLVKFNGKTYGISHKRLQQSTCDDAVELFISQDDKWLIPSDTTSAGIEVDW